MATPARYEASTCTCARAATWYWATFCCSTACAAIRFARAAIQVERALARVTASCACDWASRARSSLSCAYLSPLSYRGTLMLTIRSFVQCFSANPPFEL